MTRYVLTISYDGGDYNGFQRQPNLVTVQGELEKVLAVRLQQPIKISASGRTDSGVHALKQYVQFDTDKVLDCDKFAYSINTMLPKSIAINNCVVVQDDFHVRYNAKKKTYVYQVYLSKINCPLKRRYYYICGYDLDIQKMKQACTYFIGEHDFRSFMLSDDKKNNTVRTIYSLEIKELDNSKELHFEISGNGFLHNMVRCIVGTLIDIGRGRFSIDSVKSMLNAKDRSTAGKTLDGCGLYLKDVEY